MNYSEWKKKIVNLPETVKRQIAASAVMKQPSDYVSQVTCNCESADFLELLDNAVRAIQDNYTRVTGVQLEPVMVDYHWYKHYANNINALMLEKEIYGLLDVPFPSESNNINKLEDTIARVLNVSTLFNGFGDALASSVQATLREYKDTDAIRMALSVIWGLASVLTRFPRIDRRFYSEVNDSPAQPRTSSGYWTVEPVRATPDRVQTFRL